MVQQQFERLFSPEAVLRVHMAYDTRKVDALVREYLRVRQQLLDLLDAEPDSLKKRSAAKRRSVRAPTAPSLAYQRLLCIKGDLRFTYICMLLELCKPSRRHKRAFVMCRMPHM